MTTGNPFSYEKFLWILERDHMFLKHAFILTMTLTNPNTTWAV